MTGQPLVDHPVAADDPGTLPPIADVYRWSVEQAAHLRAGRFDLLDIATIADEIEAVGRSDYNALVSALAVLLQHMLKWDHQPERRSRSWINSIAEHRLRISDGLKQSPSLKAKREEILKEAYPYGRLRASTETNLPASAFPDVCPYSWDEITGRPFQLTGEEPQ